MSVLGKARKVAGAVGTATAVAAIVGLKVTGRPVKDKDKPAAVDAFGVRWFEREPSGKQYVLWWRIRDARVEAKR